MRINDRVFGMFMLILAVVYGLEASKFPEPFGGAESVGPETFPIILSFILGISAIYMMVRPDPDQAWPVRSMLIELVITALSIMLFAWAIEFAGFIIAAFCVVSYLSWRMGSKPLNSVITGAVSSVTIFLLFNHVLELALPLGLLEF